MSAAADPAGMEGLRGLVLAPFGRDAALLAAALRESGASARVCPDMDALLAAITDGSADIVVLSDGSFGGGGGDRLLAALDARPMSDLLPLVLLTASTDLAHPLARRPGLLIVAKPTRRRILESVIRGALDMRRRVVELRRRRREAEERSASLEAARAELASRNDELLDALHAHNRFVATMSHELRTPLNAILGFTDLLTHEIAGPVTDGQRIHLERIRVGANHLMELIEEILDLSKAQAGGLRLEVRPIDVEPIVLKAMSLVMPQAEAKGLRLAFDAGHEPLPKALGDLRRVHQVLLNLVSNAVKFTDEGSVSVRLSRRGEDTIQIVVEDTGRGMAPDILPQIFREFYQASDDLGRSHGGTGLGLAISKRLAELMDGDLTVESQPGKGSAFTFTLLAYRGDEAPDEGARAVRQRPGDTRRRDGSTREHAGP